MIKMDNTTNEATLGGRFTFPGTSLTVQRMGYGAMQLAGPGVWGPPKDPEAAIAVLREAVAAGVNHIDTATSTARTSPTRSSGRPCTPIPRDW
jgi:predicted aldo/keto reductase-like oxidoreductase